MKLALILAATLAFAQENEVSLREALQAKTGTVTLTGGTVEISREIVMPGDAHDLKIAGGGTTIKAASTFRGRALIVLPAGKNIQIQSLKLDGSRVIFTQPVGQVPASTVLSREIANNGIFADGVTGLEISQVRITEIAGFPIVVDTGRNIRIHDVEIGESGSLDAEGHNNGTGGILLEEGTTDFEVQHALMGKVRGNGIWIRSAEGSAAASKGRIADNEFAIVARAAIELNHVTDVTVENNIASMIGFPGEETRTGGTAMPSAITSTGSVEHALLRDNTFGQIAGRCLSLDGFNAGEVSGNSCSDGLFNGFLIRGAGNRVIGNRLTGLNQARRDQPDSLKTGIYLAGASSGNTLDGNQVSGFGMAKFCIGGPSIASNNIVKNVCSDGASVARLQPARPR